MVRYPFNSATFPPTVTPERSAMTKTGGSRPRPDKVAESRHPGQAGGGPGIDRPHHRAEHRAGECHGLGRFPGDAPPPFGSTRSRRSRRCGTSSATPSRRCGAAAGCGSPPRAFDVRCPTLFPSNSAHRTSNVESNGDFIEISVADTGEGIAPESMEKLFQPLFSTKSRGVGLGLPICKNFVEANGGRIEVVSRLGKGTTFTVALPVEGGEHGT